MKINKNIVVLLNLIILSCNSNHNSKEQFNTVLSVGAMKNVMWKGELKGVVSLDTLKNNENLYGLGPAEYLGGEILVIDGKSYKSKVVTDSTMAVTNTSAVKPPFFVYSNVKDWEREILPKDIKTLDDFETYMNSKFEDSEKPFTFQLKGQITQATIHIQNLPKGSKVSSPEEAHQGQTNYSLTSEDVEIVGFYSKHHSGIYTHHDSNMHMHLITKDRQQMGHLDSVVFTEGMELYFSK